MKRHLIIIFCFLLAFRAFGRDAQQVRTEVSVDFRVNRTEIDPAFRDNAEQLERIASLIERMQADPKIEIYSIWFCGTASPEGSYQTNKRLSHSRMDALESMVRRRISIPDEIIEHDDAYIPWNKLIAMVNADQIDGKEQILEILNSESQIVTYATGRTIDSRIIELKKLDGGRVWQQMFERYFAPLRNATVIIVTNRELTPRIIPTDAEPHWPVAEIVPPTIIPHDFPKVVVEEEPEPEALRHWYLKSNAVGIGMLIANIAGEIDFADHWSATLPIYYSALNYFTRTLKFRTFTVQPEVRYWLSPANDGFFVGGHLGLAFFNYALNGDFRIQDHRGKSPALGGGIAIGYRLPFRAGSRWKAEFSLGAGIYTTHYDKYRNYFNGPLVVNNTKKTFIGIDQAAVTIAYTFDLR